MMIAAALIVGMLGANGAEAVKAADPFIAEAEGWLLNGETLPKDYRQRLLAMPPEKRLQALVFLRRAGLLTERAWPVDEILRPSAAGDAE